MSIKIDHGTELVRVNEYFIGSGKHRLKVGIAEDGTLLFGLPPIGKAEQIIALERTEAAAILRHLLGVLDDSSKWPKPGKA
ncbi:MAG: hypothetical protein DMF84_09110 [Acidobacteria bacterium]|nr:MAG: hypothetical protein DMF84_09110 [Acidobacteriota bacterium]